MKGKVALVEMTKNGLPSKVPFEQAKLLAQEKSGHITNQYIQNAGKNFSKLKIDSLENGRPFPRNRTRKRPDFLKRTK